MELAILGAKAHSEAVDARSRELRAPSLGVGVGGTRNDLDSVGRGEDPDYLDDQD